jgi:hypothetical protein
MRTFTEVSDDRLLAVLPAKQADKFQSALTAALASNAKMQTFYRGHKASFAG